MSLAQYLAERVSAEIRSNGDSYQIEGATLSRMRLGELRFFKAPGHADLRNSNTEAGFDLSLFGLRPVS